MKITSGIYKYRKIEVPRGIRPTTEKVREAIFSMVMQWLPGAAVLDLFAGSGAMGLEALSRGAEHCWFCEVNRQNQKTLTANIANCGAGEKSAVIGKDYVTALSEIAGRTGSGAMRNSGVCFDLVILDPPYEQTEYYGKAMTMLQAYELIDEGSVVISEHLYDNKLSADYGCLHRIKEKKYGSIGVDVYIMSNSANSCAE